MTYLIADSGSTKTSWILTDGTTRRELETMGINPVRDSEEEIEKVIDQLISRPTPPPSLVGRGMVFFYGAGCIPPYSDVVRRVLERRFPEAEIHVESDLLGAAHALCGSKEGIACILGTGSNSCLYDGQRIVENVSPLGWILGDEGSGAVLGKLLVGDVLKKQLPEHLCEKFMKEYNLDYTTIITSVYRKPAANRFLAQFAPFLEHNIDEPAIHNIVLRSFTDFFTRNVASYPNYKELPCNFVGSIAHCEKAVLHEAAQALGITIGTIIKDPMEGLVKYHSAEVE